MICPYRKNITSEGQSDGQIVHVTNVTVHVTTVTYADCSGEECPLYDSKLIKKCWRVQKEINDAYIFGKEGYYEHR